MSASKRHLHIVFDAIHQTMTFKDEHLHCVRKIIDKPCFQRLKGIKQLGFADIVFPTATHSRFSHALGTAFLCWRMIKILGLNIKKNAKIYEVVFAALLHDIGHGPFSHAFEDFLKDYIKLEVDHESWAEIFVKKNYTEIFREYDFKQLSNYITGSKKEKVKQDVFYDLISSQLDADRLDFLLRDSYFCGVQYGNYDLEWLLSCLDTYPKNGKGCQRLAITYKGIGAVENYLMNRRLMYKNIYHHKVIRGYDHYFKHLMTLLVDAIAVNKISSNDMSPALYNYLLAVKKHKNEDDYKREDRKKIGNYMEAVYDTYSKLCDYDFWITIRQLSGNKKVGKNLKELLDCFYKRTPPYMTMLGIEHDAAREIIRGLKCKEWQMAVVKANVKMYDSEEEPILVIDEGGEAQDIRNVSEVVRKMGGDIEPKYYVLINRNYFEKNEAAVIKVLKKLKCPLEPFRRLGYKVVIEKI